MENLRISLSLLEVDVTSATSENGSNIREAWGRGGEGGAGVVGLLVGRGGGDDKGVPHGWGQQRQQQLPPTGIGSSVGVF